jgi:hypothetical protein
MLPQKLPQPRGQSRGLRLHGVTVQADSDSAFRYKSELSAGSDDHYMSGAQKLPHLRGLRRRLRIKSCIVCLIRTRKSYCLL